MYSTQLVNILYQKTSSSEVLSVCNIIYSELLIQNVQSIEHNFANQVQCPCCNMHKDKNVDCNNNTNVITSLSCVSSSSLLGKKFLGYPVRIDDKLYERNAFLFNFCFVFKPNTQTVVFETIVRKINDYMVKRIKKINR